MRSLRAWPLGEHARDLVEGPREDEAMFDLNDLFGDRDPETARLNLEVASLRKQLVDLRAQKEALRAKARGLIDVAYNKATKTAAKHAAEAGRADIEATILLGLRKVR